MGKHKKIVTSLGYSGVGFNSSSSSFASTVSWYALTALSWLKGNYSLCSIKKASVFISYKWVAIN